MAYVHTTRKIKSIQPTFYHVIILCSKCPPLADTHARSCSQKSFTALLS